MPIYEYVCMSCESHFEELVRPDELPPCPDCGSEHAKRQFSAFAAHGLTKQPGLGQPSLGQPSLGGGAASGGGCCGGSCGCGH